MLIEVCNFTNKSRAKHINIDSDEFTRRYVPRRKKRFTHHCRPINDSYNSCYEFIPNTPTEDILSESFKSNAIAGLVFFPLWFKAMGEKKHYDLLKTIRTQIQKHQSDQLIIGIDQYNLEALFIRSLAKKHIETERSLYLYNTPFKMGWPYSEAKFIRRFRSIINREFKGKEEILDKHGRPILDENGNKTYREIVIHKVNISC
jgi:hypothetical protein